MSEAQGERIRFCSQCGSDVPFDEPVCPVCSHAEGSWPGPSGNPSPCRECDGEVAAGVVYCSRCGALQTEGEPLVPSYAGAVPDEPPTAGRSLFAQTIVLLAPALLLGAIMLALR